MPAAKGAPFPLPHQPVANPRHGQNQGWAAGVRLNLLAQAANVDVDGPLALDVAAIAPAGLDNLAAAANLDV